MNRRWLSQDARYAKFVLVAIALMTPSMAYTALRAVQNKSNRVIDWLPASYSETDDLKWFRDHFVGDQFVVVSWEGCRLGDNPSSPQANADDPRIERLANALAQPNGLSTGEPDYFKSVMTARRLLNQMTFEPTNLPYPIAMKRIQGSMIGPDGHQTCVVVMLTDEAIGDFRGAVGRASTGLFRIPRQEGVLLRTLRDCGVDPDTAYLGGPPVDSVAIDEEGERTLYRLAALAALVGLALAWWSLQSIRLTLIVFACGCWSSVASLSAVWFTGGTTDSFLLSMPSLVYVLAISGAVHLVKYYRDAVDEFGAEGAPARAIADGWKPTLLCSVTTAFGLLSLCTSDLTPVRRFGIYSSLGVMLMLFSLFVFLPAALRVWPLRSKPTSEHRSSTLDAFWQSIGRWIIEHFRSVTVVCIGLVITVGIGVTRVRTTIDLMKLFDSEARIRRDYQWLESNVARLVPMEIIVRFDRNALRRGDQSVEDRERYSLLERVESIASIQHAIDNKFGVRGADVTGQSLSACTFVSLLPRKGRDIRTIARRSATNVKMNNHYHQLLDSGYVAIDQADHAELWRISVRVAAFKGIDYGQFVEELRRAVDPLVNQLDVDLDRRRRSVSPDNVAIGHSSQAISAIYTGVIPIVYKAQRALLDSLIESTFWSFITITPLVMIVSRGFWAGATAMLPNTLPVLMVFGGMGWMGIPVAIGSMMSAGIALGVAVDDTIHFLMWFRKELDLTSDRKKASLAAYRRCASPTLQAALVSGFGLSVFALSTFMPTKQFGLLMLTILLTGVVAELVMLPALLAGPLGQSFQPRNKTR